jgi:uncharacterized protein (TIGR03437 family)
MALAAVNSPAYYHFLHYQSRLGPFTPIPEKFDLNALPNKTVYFYVSDKRPALAPGDAYEALVAQVRQALGVWNSVATSDLRVAFGGVADLETTPSQSPGGEIVFEELAPGILGMGSPTSRLPQVNGFIPVVKSRLILPNQLTNPNRTSASESFFNSLVHEIGHALGLQHVATGAAMSMEPTRSTTRARPLGPDDIAGISALYPAAGFSSSTGVIAGRVTTPSGRPLHLVSVVAVNPSGAAISALAGPDGVYRMEGVPPGTYLVYAHSLPPATQAGLGPAGVVLPVDGAGAPIEAAGPVETQFFGGGRDPNTSIPVVVNSGAASEGIDFRLAEKTALPIYDVTTYSFPGNSAPAVFPAYLNITRNSGSLIATGPGLVSNLAATTVGVIGGGVQVRSRGPYAPDPRFAEVEMEFNPFIGTGSRHLIFTTGSDVYVRPAGVQLVTRPAPLVRQTQVEGENGSTVLVLAGDNLAADSRVFVDGAPATPRGFDEITGRLRVAPPPGMGGRSAVITVYNSDGQSSAFVQPLTPALYTYPPSDAPSIAVTPNSAAAGRDVTVEIQGTGTHFVDGQTVVGFGTPDVVVRRVWVVSPTRLVAVISVSPRAPVTGATVSVLTGSELALAPAGFRVEAAATTASAAPVIGFQALVNSATGQPRVAPGSLATLFGTNLALGGTASANVPLPTTLGGTTVTLNDRPVPLLLVSPTQINMQLPFSLTPGPAILRVNNGAETSAPMAVHIDAVAPGLFRVTTPAGAVIDAGNPARLGDNLVLYATGLGAVTPPATAGAPAGQATVTATVRVHLNGIELTPAFAGLAPTTAGLYQINLPLPAVLPLSAAASIFVTVDGVASNALTIGLR